MEKWTQCWLAYRLREDKGNIPLLENIRITGFPESEKMIQHAVLELQNGVKGMLGVDVKVIRSEMLYHGVSINCCPEIEAEGYHIKETDGIVHLQASDGAGALYGIFHLLDLDIDVQRLKLLKANHLSQRYALEDQIIKVLPQKIASFEQRIEGYTADMNRLKENTHPTADGFSPMEVEGTVYTDKRPQAVPFLPPAKL